MKVFAVNIGTKYGPEYNQYIKQKLSRYDVHIIKEPYDPQVILQWNKMYPMSLDIDEPVCVIDIDILLVNDYYDLFEHPIKRGQFVGLGSWWNEDIDINGGFFKYYPKDCRYIFDKFTIEPDYWMRHYIEKGVTQGPVNGEQFFVKEAVDERLELVRTPEAWCTRWMADDVYTISRGAYDDHNKWVLNNTNKYREATGNNYIYLGGQFHSDIKLVHFTHALNKPHEWKQYEQFKTD